MEMFKHPMWLRLNMEYTAKTDDQQMALRPLRPLLYSQTHLFNEDRVTIHIPTCPVFFVAG